MFPALDTVVRSTRRLSTTFVATEVVQTAFSMAVHIREALIPSEIKAHALKVRYRLNGKSFH